MKLHTKTLLTLLTGSALLIGTADAATINMNHYRGSNIISGSYGTGTGELLAPVAYTGSTWNNNRGSGTALLDSDNVATAVGFTLTGQVSNNGASGTSISTEPNMDALNNYAYSNTTDAAPMVLTLTGLEIGQTYDLHILANSGATGGSDGLGQGATVTMTSGADVLPASSISGSTTLWVDATSYVLGDNYTTQSWVANATTAVFNLDDNKTDGQTYAAFNGFQLVEVVPEPNSLALLALGGLCLINRRRRD